MILINGIVNSQSATCPPLNIITWAKAAMYRGHGFQIKDPQSGNPQIFKETNQWTSQNPKVQAKAALN